MAARRCWQVLKDAITTLRRPPADDNQPIRLPAERAVQQAKASQPLRVRRACDVFALSTLFAQAVARQSVLARRRLRMCRAGAWTATRVRQFAWARQTHGHNGRDSADARVGVAPAPPGQRRPDEKSSPGDR